MTVFIIIVAVLVGFAIGQAIERRHTDKRIRMMMHLPMQSETFTEVDHTARSLQGFLSQCRCVVNPYGELVHDERLSKCLTQEQRSMSNACYFSPTIHALVDLCHKVGVEIVLRRKDTGEERTY